MFVVVDLQGHQYIIKEGDKIVVDRIKDKEKDSQIIVDKVLMVFDEKGENIEIWQPYLKKEVIFKVVDHIKEKKINVIKFKNKNRYFRKYGFRPYKTILQVESIK